MKIGITQIIIGKMTLDETLELCKDAGYEAVELVFDERSDLAIDMTDDEIRKVGERCRAAGVEVSSVIAWYNDRGNMLSRHAGERETAKRGLIRSLEIAGVIGSGAVLLHPGQLTAEGTYQQAWDDFVRDMREVAKVAEANQAAIAIENVWNKFLLSPKEIRELVDEIASPWVGVYLDTANMMAYGFPEHWIRELGERIKRVHFKDFVRRDHKFVPLTEGDTDWPQVMKELAAIGYTEPVIHEVGGDREVLIEMARRMRQIVS